MTAIEGCFGDDEVRRRREGAKKSRDFRASAVNGARPFHSRRSSRMLSPELCENISITPISLLFFRTFHNAPSASKLTPTYNLQGLDFMPSAGMKFRNR